MMIDFLVTQKILQSLTLHFEYVVATIEESKDLNDMSIVELQGSLVANEHRLNLKMFVVANKDAL